MSKTVKVNYNSDTFEIKITVDGHPFDTARINGKEIGIWAYPFMIRKTKWNGFYDEMTETLGEKSFDLIFIGSDESLSELKEALGEAPVTIISNTQMTAVKIMYDERSLKTIITIDDADFDTARIEGMEIEDWIYPFMIRKTKWDGLFSELEKAIGSDSYVIQFMGNSQYETLLKEECPPSVVIMTEGKEKLIAHLCTALSNRCYYMKKIDDILFFSSEEAMLKCLAHDGIYDFYDRRIRLAVPETFWTKYKAELLEKAKGYVADKKEPGHRPKRSGKAEVSGDAAALAIKYFHGNGVKQSKKRAFQYCKEALKQDRNNAEINYIMGRLYLGAEGIDKDPEEAIRCFQRSADAGYEKADQALQDAKTKYADDLFWEGVWQEEQGNADSAFEVYRKAAEYGSADANNWLGLILSEEKRAKKFHISIDIPKALEYFRIAAEAGLEVAMYNLGMNLFDETDDTYQAIDWLEKAVNAGYEDAKELLDEVYASMQPEDEEAPYDPDQHQEYYECFHSVNYQPYKEPEKNFIYSLFFYYPVEDLQELSAHFRDYNNSCKTGKGKYSYHSDYYNEIYPAGYPDELIDSEETENKRASLAKGIVELITNAWGKKNPMTAYLSYLFTIFKSIADDPDYYKSKLEDASENDVLENTISKIKTVLKRFECLIEALKKDFYSNQNSIFTFMEDINQNASFSDIPLFIFYRAADTENDSEIRKAVFSRLMFLAMERVYRYAIYCLSDGMLATESAENEEAEENFFDLI